MHALVDAPVLRMDPRMLFVMISVCHHMGQLMGMYVNNNNNPYFNHISMP